MNTKTKEYDQRATVLVAAGVSNGVPTGAREKFFGDMYGAFDPVSRGFGGRSPRKRRTNPGNKS